MYLKASKFSIHMNFLGELKHPCRHDAQNDSEVRKITHSFSIKKINISTTIYSGFFVFFVLFFFVCLFVCFVCLFVCLFFLFLFSFFFLLSLIERYLSPLFNEVIFRIKKKNVLSWHFCLIGTQVCIFLCVILWLFSREYCRKWRKIYVTRQR